MLPRDSEESIRLDFQHEFTKALSDNHLIHRSIPIETIHEVADVGTGTGIWLRDVSSVLNKADIHGQGRFVGFDISSQQFPASGLPNASLVVRDARTQFPGEYCGSFVMVHVRLLSYAVQKDELQSVVENVVQLLS